jgi:hypothetical protein
VAVWQRRRSARQLWKLPSPLKKKKIPVCVFF